MHKEQNATTRSYSSLDRGFLGLAVISILAGLLGLRMLGSHKETVERHPGAHQAVEHQIENGGRSPDPQEFFDQHIKAILDENHQEDLAAVERCLSRIRQNFATYRQGISPFAEEITSVSTRFGVLFRMPGDWWNEDGRILRFTEQIFERHLFSDARLRSDMSAALVALRDELEANRANAFRQIKVAISESDMPQTVLPEINDWELQVMEELTAYSKRVAAKSTTHFLVASAASLAIETMVEALVVRMLTSTGTAAAISAAGAGGATVTATAAGGGSGSLAGPIGTAVGIGVGLVSGLLLDYWMTSELQGQISQQLHAYINALEADLIGGTPGQRGLSRDLTELAGQLKSVQADLIMKRLNGGSN